MRWLTIIVLVLLSLSACGTVEHPLASGTDQAIPGQGADPLAYPGSTETAIVLPDTTPAASTPAVPPPSMVPSTPPLEPLPPTEVQVLTLTTEPAAWHDFTLTTIYTDTTARFEYRLFGWSSQTPRLLLTNDMSLGVLDVETKEWNEIDSHVLEATWSPNSDEIIYMKSDTAVSNTGIYSLWKWDNKSNPTKLMDIPFKIRGRPQLSWDETGYINMTFDTGIAQYELINGLIREKSLFIAPEEYISYDSEKNLENKSTFIVLAPDGRHGIITDEKGVDSSTGFIEDNKIITNITVGQQQGWYTWSQDSSIVSVYLKDTMIGVYNPQGVVKYYITHEDPVVEDLFISEWSPDNLYFIYTANINSYFGGYISKIGYNGRIVLDSEDIINGGIVYSSWSKEYPYIAYTSNGRDKDTMNFVNQIYIKMINQ